MSMIPVGSGEQQEINSLERQARQEYGPAKKAPKAKKPKQTVKPRADLGVPPKTQTQKVTPRTSVHVHPPMSR